MEFSALVILALIQGITEFLPVSSSGHLILLPQLTGTEDQGQAMDVAVHVGTLFAVMLYFWRDMIGLVAGTLNILTGKLSTPNAKLVLLLILATIPVIIAWSVRDAVIMGLWQAVALIPGTSRSGATITASRFLGFDRRDGAKLAMLMSIPTIAASGILIGADAYATITSEQVKDLVIGAVLSFVAALFALGLMMKLLGSVNYTPYVIYRVILGLILLFIGYS